MLEAARDLGANRWETFRRVTWPMSRAAVVVSLLVTTLPMLGDYFTNDLLSGSPDTSMVGNLINNSVLTPGQTGQAGAFVVLILIVSIVPMVAYVRSTRTGADVRSDPHEGAQLVAGPVAQTAGAAAVHPAVSRLVAAAGAGGRALLVQRRPVPRDLAGLLDAVVLRRPAALGLARRQPAHGAHAHAVAGGRGHGADRSPRGRDGAGPGPVAGPDPGRRQPRRAGVVRAAGDPGRRLAAVRRHRADHAAGPRHHRPGDRAGHVPAVLPGRDRPSSPAHDRQGLRGGGRRPGSLPARRGPPGAGEDAAARDLRQCRARLRRRDRRLHHRPLPLGRLVDGAGVGEGLQHREGGPDARAERSHHPSPRGVAARRGARLPGLPLVHARGEGRRAPSTPSPPRRSLERPFSRKVAPMVAVPPAPLDPAEVALALAPFGSSRMLPRAAYLDDAVLAWEREQLFGGWMCVGPVRRHPGGWCVRPVGGGVRRPADPRRRRGAARRSRTPAGIAATSCCPAAAGQRTSRPWCARTTRGPTASTAA